MTHLFYFQVRHQGPMSFNSIILNCYFKTIYFYNKKLELPNPSRAELADLSNWYSCQRGAVKNTNLPRSARISIKDNSILTADHQVSPMTAPGG